nr:MAG TPA: hypothetical protein [Caudoviricetes sp.]
MDSNQCEWFMVQHLFDYKVFRGSSNSRSFISTIDG